MLPARRLGSAAASTARQGAGLARDRFLSLDEIVARLLHALGRGILWLAGKPPLIWLVRAGARLIAAFAWLGRSPRRLGLTAGLALAAGATLAQLDAVLKGLHLPGAGSFRLGDLADVGFHVPRVGRAELVVKTWNDYAAGAHREVAAIFLGLDSAVFAPAFTAILAIAAIRLRGRMRVHGGARAPDEPMERLLRIALLATPALLAADELENLASLLAVFWARPEWLVWSLWLSSTVKWLLLALIVLPSLAIGLWLAWMRRGRRGAELGAALVRLRVQLLLVLALAGVLLFLPAYVSSQSADAIRRWIPDGVDAAAAGLLTLWFSLLTLVSARRLLAPVPQPRREPPRLLLAGLTLIAVAVVLNKLEHAGQGLYVLGGGALAVALLSIPTRKLVPPPLPAIGYGARVLPALLAGVPLVALGLAVLRASVVEVAYLDHPWFWLLIWVGVGLQALGWALFALTRSLGPALDRHARLFLSASGAAAAALVLLVWVEPWRIAGVLGTIGVLVGFLAAATLVLYLLVAGAQRRRPPPVFSVLRLRQAPVLVLLVAWALLASAVDRKGGYYDVRRVETPAALAKEGFGVREAFGDWAGRQGDRPAVPMLLVAAPGGGIRAAYWTALVLDCVLEGLGETCPAPGGGPADAETGRRALFAASGVSGGSLGLVEYLAHTLRGEDSDWVDDRLGGDYLAPTLAWGLFADLPTAFVRRDGGTDRAEVLERAWERSWAGPGGREGELARGFFETWAERERRPVPLLLLNGTKVQDGCRFNSSVLDANVELPPDPTGGRPEQPRRLVEDCVALRLFEEEPGPGLATVDPSAQSDWALASTSDLVDYLCPEEDVRLSTAALMSARFPYVLPSGRLTKCGDPDGRSAVNLVDGGYFDTSAASPLVELWARLEPLVAAHNSDPANACVVPVFLQIDNGYADAPGPEPGPRPWESQAPLRALGAARNAREANARQAAALAFTGGLDPVQEVRAGDGSALRRFAHVYPRAHPGAQAPLGWTLSDAAADDLRDQLRSRENGLELAKVRSWFGDLTCVR